MSKKEINSKSQYKRIKYQKGNIQVVRTTSEQDENTKTDFPSPLQILYTSCVKEVVCKDLLKLLDKELKDGIRSDHDLGIDSAREIIKQYVKN